MVSKPAEPDELFSTLQKKQRPISKVIEPFLPEVEQKISEGFLLSDIVEALNEAGIEITLFNLKQILYRYRKKTERQPLAAELPKPLQADETEPNGNPVKSEALTTPSEQNREDRTHETLEDVLERQRQNNYSVPPRRSKLLGNQK